MKKGLIIILGILLVIIGCGTYYLSQHNWLRKVTTVISFNESNKFQFDTNVMLKNVIHIKDGKILSKDKKLDTSEVGKFSEKITYLNSNNFKKTYVIEYEIVDTIPPILSVSSNIYRIVGSEDTLTKGIFCGDNYDRDVELGVRGDYNLNKEGTYKIKYYAKDSSGNETVKDSTLHVYYDDGKKSSSSSKGKRIDIQEFIDNYKNEHTSIGIDISKWQGNIDFNKVKDSGVEFIFIRVGYGPNEDLVMTVDPKFEEYYEGATKAGLPIGIYLYSYATDVKEAAIQSNFVISRLKGKKIDLGVAYDWENWSSFHGFKLNFSDLNKMATDFLDNIEKGGYKGLNYSSKYYLENVWKINKYDTWLAHYTDKTTYNGKYSIWQLSSNGSVPGINGAVDINIMYK